MLRNQKGFTLIEILAVLIIIAIICSTLVIKFDLITGMTDNVGSSMVIDNLNTREKMTWFNLKLADGGYVNDEELFKVVDYNVDIIWISGPKPFGGTVNIADQALVLIRNESTLTEPATWRE